VELGSSDKTALRLRRTVPTGSRADILRKTASADPAPAGLPQERSVREAPLHRRDARTPTDSRRCQKEVTDPGAEERLLSDSDKEDRLPSSSRSRIALHK